MDARLDTLSTELYQMNVCVNRIARWQAIIGDFASEASHPPPPMASDSEDEDDDDGNDDDVSNDDDGDASSTDVYLTLLPFITRDKKGE